MQNVTLNLSDSLMNRAKLSANALKRHVEEILSTMLEAMLPEVSDVPVELQAEMARMTWLNNEKLWECAHQVMPEKQQKELDKLGKLQEQRTLTDEESRKLVSLRAEYGRIMLVKARA